MALYPVKILLPYQVDSGDTKSFELEEQVLTTAKTIFDPVLFFINKSSELAHLKIEWHLDTGAAGANDPLLTGAYCYTAVDDDVNAGDMLPYDFMGNNLDNDDDLASRHSIYLQNKGAQTQIYWVLLVGRADIRVQLPANQEIIKE